MYSNLTTHIVNSTGGGGAPMDLQYQQQQQQLQNVEYTLAIDSHTRDVARYPEPNDFVMAINGPQKSMPIMRMYLGSIELPLAQQTIEEEWSRLYFDEGIAVHLPILNPADLATFVSTSIPAAQSSELMPIGVTVKDSAGLVYTAYIPPWLNPTIIQGPYDSGVDTVYTFITYYPHGLHLRTFYNYGVHMQFVSIAGAVSYPIDDSSSGVILNIIDANTFTIALASTPAPPPVNPSTSALSLLYGYLHAPVVSNPSVFAQMLTEAVRAEAAAVMASSRVVFTYDVSTNLFRAQAVRTEAYTGGPEQPTVLYASGSGALSSVGTLPHMMGFPCANIPLSIFDLSAGSCSSVMSAQAAYLCTSSLRVTPANYTQATVSSVLADMQLQFSRFYFEEACGGDGSVLPTLMIADRCGVCHEITIPFGKYSPADLAKYLEVQINAALPNNATADAYSVEFITTSVADLVTAPLITPGMLAGQFIFTSEDGYPFAIMSGDPKDTLSARLGFAAPVCYRQSNLYASDVLYVPIKGCYNCPDDDGPFLSNVYTPFVNSATRTVNLQVCNARPISGLTVSAVNIVSNTDATVELTDATRAHGYQVGDVISVVFSTLPAEPRMRRVRVASVDSAFTFTIDVSGQLAQELSDIPLALDDGVCASLYSEPVFNLYFTGYGNGATPANSSSISECASAQQGPPNIYKNAMYAEMLGFRPEAILWDATSISLPVSAPFHYALEHPEYLLVEFVTPSESTYIQHQWGNDLKSRLFGKIVVYPNLRMERHYPIEAIFRSSKLISSLHVRIYNPNHTLYNFHGRNWSMTLVLVAAIGTARPLCM